MYIVKKLGAVLIAAALGSCVFNQAAAENELKGQTLTALVVPSGAPMGYLSEDLLHTSGVDIDIIRELQRRLGFKLTEDRVIPQNFSEGMKRVLDGRADIISGGISLTPARAEQYGHTPVYLASSLTVLYSKTHNPDIKTISDIKGKTIGVQEGSPSEVYAEKLGARPVYFYSNVLANFMVATGKYDGMIFDRPPTADFARVMKTLNLDVTDEPFGQETCRFALLMPKNKSYNKLIHDTVQEMIDDGTIAAILKKWHVE